MPKHITLIVSIFLRISLNFAIFKTFLYMKAQASVYPSIKEEKTMKKEVLYEITTALERLDNPNEALKLVAKVLTNTGLEQMRSRDFSEVIEGSQILWMTLRTMKRLAERDPEDTSVRAIYFSMYRVMLGAFVSKDFGEDLDKLADEVEDFVEERDASLPVDYEMHKHILRLLDRKTFHQMRWARNKEVLNRHD